MPGKEFIDFAESPVVHGNGNVQQAVVFIPEFHACNGFDAVHPALTDKIHHAHAVVDISQCHGFHIIPAGFSDKLLIGATTIPLDEVLRLIHDLNGLAIASHIDREAFSIIGQLGFIPDNLGLDALEISPSITPEEAKKKYAYNYPITSSSDAHHPDDIGKSYTTFLLQEGTVIEIKKALKNEDGRKLIH